MADDADRADIEVENNEAAARVRAGHNVPHLIACGACHSCGNPLPAGRLYCNNLCADDHASDMKRLKELGRG